MRNKRYRPRNTVITIAIISLLMAVLAFAGFPSFHPIFAIIAKIQFGPALLSCIAAFTVGSLAICLSIVLLTLLFGRFYCAVICPLGIVQDFCYNGIKGSGANINNLPWFRYFILAIVTALLLSGITIGLQILDPYTNFGRIISFCHFLHKRMIFRIFLLSPIILIVLLALWKGRVYCVSFCPVGAFLGLLSKHSLFHLSFTDKCVKCNRCAKKCPSGCLDPKTGKVDNEICVRCMRCVQTCKVEGISFKVSELASWRVSELTPVPPQLSTLNPQLSTTNSKTRKLENSHSTTLNSQHSTLNYELANSQTRKLANSQTRKLANSLTAPNDPSRRAFIRNSAWLIGGLITGAALAKSGLIRLGENMKRRLGILPPGAGSAERFANKCTGCGLCIKSCPSNIITPAPGGIGPVSLDLSRGYCAFDCNNCGHVCPTGAIHPLTLTEKRKAKIAEAKLDPSKCIVFQEGEQCGKCAQACHVNAITLRKTGAPRPPNLSLCIGCGACANACPVKAMTIHPLDHLEDLTFDV